MRKPEDVRVFGMADGVSEKYSNAVAAGAGMLGKTEGELVETLTVNVEPGGALSPGSTIVPLIPPVEGNVVESVCAREMDTLWFWATGAGSAGCDAVGATPFPLPPLHAASITREVISATPR
ncbi:MAG: hypothetical protein ACXVAK_18405 [Vulcanimicrobiaceae bacterium]